MASEKKDPPAVKPTAAVAKRRPAPLKVTSARADAGPGAALAVRAPEAIAPRTAGATHSVQTVMEPWKTITVDDVEYAQLLAQGLVYSGSPVTPAADGNDLLIADKIAHGTATPAALKAALGLPVAATATTSGTLAGQKHNPVDATTGALTMTLPTGAAAGTLMSVEKTDATANAVTVSGSLRGGASTISLVWARETLLLVADASGSWWPVAGHKTKSSLDVAYGRVAPVRRARGAVCFTWDDGFAAHDTIRQQADALGQKHTFAVVSGTIGNPNRLTSAQVLTAFQNGHEISSHTVDHADISTLTQAQRIVEYDNSKTTIEAIIGAGNCRTFTYPFGSLNRTATSDQELWLRYDRILNTGSASGSSGSPYMYRVDELRAGSTPFLIGRFPWTSANHPRWLNLIRQAAVMPIVVSAYAHNPGDPNNPTLAQITEAMNLAASLGIPCITTTEAFPASSLLVDPGFEDPALNGWLVATSGGVGSLGESIADTPMAGLTGSRSLHLAQTDSGGAGFAYASQQVPVIPGTTYTLSFRYRSNTTGVSFTRPRARTLDYLGNVITQNQANLTNVQATWANGSLVFTADATAASVLIDFVININTGDAWFDHVALLPTALGVYG